MKKFIRYGLPLLILCAWLAPAEWQAIGPYGGEVRSLATDPLDSAHLFLGTTNGQVYTSRDGGRHWAHLSELAARHDLVVDHLIVDSHEPRLLYAGAWSLEGAGGGVFRSTDSGLTWTELAGISGQSVRALVVAPTSSRLLVAGTLEGVFRSTDSGASWHRISPVNDPEIRNVESLALDPENPAIIYAGTWHLPWKTVDGGAHWFSVKEGIIDDSDVFSIAVDWANRQTVYLSACSGIYRTDTAGQQWSKIQGIPYSARRTRVIRQDPRSPGIVYAGTTEGLWKTDSGGAGWRRLTPATLTVNDILLDSSNPSHLFLATERAGVLESENGGETFREANQGFSHRQLSRLLVDPDSGRVLVSVIHDTETGGVYASPDTAAEQAQLSGATGDREGAGAWQRWSEGLEGRDVLALARVPGRALLAGTADGLFRFQQDRPVWVRAGRLWKAPPPEPLRQRTNARGSGRHSGARSRRADRPSLVAVPLILRINDLALSSTVDRQGAPLEVYAATSEGVLRSGDGGETWRAISPPWEVDRLAVGPDKLVAATSSGIAFSTTGGVRWTFGSLPAEGVSVSALAVAGEIQAGPSVAGYDCAREMVYAATNRGLFQSPDAGRSWERKGQGVPFGPVGDVLVEPADPCHVYVAALTTGLVYESVDAGRTYRPLSRDGVAGRQPLRLAFSSKGVLHLATASDGAFVWLGDAGRRAAAEKIGQ